MDEMVELKLRVEALEIALQAALKHSPDAAKGAREALREKLDELVQQEPAAREPGFQRMVQMQPPSPTQDARKASLARLLRLLSEQ